MIWCCVVLVVVWRMIVGDDPAPYSRKDES